MYENQRRDLRDAVDEIGGIVNRRTNRKRSLDLKPTGEPDAVKVARPVRRGQVEKVPFNGNSLACYPTAVRVFSKQVICGVRQSYYETKKQSFPVFDMYVFHPIDVFYHHIVGLCKVST